MTCSPDCYHSEVESCHCFAISAGVGPPSFECGLTVSYCLEFGKKFKMLKRHLTTNFLLNPDQYCARWNLPADYPMVAPEYAGRRRKLAITIGSGRTSAVMRGRKLKA